MAKYENNIIENKSSVEKLLTTGKDDDIISAIIGAVNGIDDFQWLQDLCFKYVHHKNFWVAKTAINSLGDIARIYKTISLKEVYLKLNKVEDERLKPVISDAIEDILMFVDNGKGIN